nr:universal stress protein [Lysobacter sp. CAU 1642]
MATDLGPAAAALAHRLGSMAGRCVPQGVQLVHVLDSRALRTAVDWGLGEPTALRARIEDEASAGLDRLRAKLRLPAGVAFQSAVLEGSPGARIVEYCRKPGIDLLIAGSGNRLWRQALIGSTARRLVREIDCALWLAREHEDAAQQIDRAVLAVDFGDSGGRALEMARRCWPDVALEAVHVIDQNLLSSAASLTQVEETAAADAAREVASERLSDWLRKQGSDGIEARILIGHPVRSLLEEVAAGGAQALVLGRGDRADGAAHLGGTAEALTLQAECDLLIAGRR